MTVLFEVDSSLVLKVRKQSQLLARSLLTGQLSRSTRKHSSSFLVIVWSIAYLALSPSARMQILPLDVKAFIVHVFGQQGCSSFQQCLRQHFDPGQSNRCRECSSKRSSVDGGFAVRGRGSSADGETGVRGGGASVNGELGILDGDTGVDGELGTRDRGTSVDGRGSSPLIVFLLRMKSKFTDVLIA